MTKRNELETLIEKVENRTAFTAILLDLVKQLYMTPECGAGGPLHIVLDDYNTDDDDITWCLRNMANPEFEEYSEEVEKLCYKIGGLLLMVPEEERLELVSNAWVYAADAVNKENQNGRISEEENAGG